MTTFRKVRFRFWLCLAASAITLLLPAAAQATTNVVPNPGFEQGGCGSTPIICGWVGNPVMSQDTTNPHSGSASMALDCGPLGCYASGGFAYLFARTDPTFCAAIGPGIHPASFWYRTLPEGSVTLFATFFQAADCTGAASGVFSDWATGDDAWHEATGELHAPPGTESALFELGINYLCDDFCGIWARFDDLDVEDTVVPDATPPETTVTSGPSGTTADSSAMFEFTASEPSSFECSLDNSGFAACASPKTYTGLAEGSHTFRVRATDPAGNTDPTPAERSWIVHANVPPVARFSFSCTALACSFDGSGSSDPDGSIATYSWNFGDGTSGNGGTTSHSYVQPAGYLVTLTVTDNDGATGTVSQTITLISLSARGYKLRGLQKVDLAWSGPGGASLDVYRDGARIATVQASAYTDNLNKKGSGTYAYKVCAASVCSNAASVTFR